MTTYYTPYYTTIVFDAEDWFQAGVANICNCAQLLPIYTKTADVNAAPEVAEYITPEVIIFDSLGVTQSLIDAFFKRGYTKIKVVYAHDIPQPEDAIKTNERVLLITYKNMDDYITVRGGFTAYHLLDIMRVHKFADTSDYEVPDLTAESAKWFVDGVFDSLARPDPIMFGSTIGRIVDSFKSFKLEEEYMMRGRIVAEVKQRLARELVSHAIMVSVDDSTPGDSPSSTDRIPLVHSTILHQEIIAAAHEKYNGVVIADIGVNKTRCHAIFANPTESQKNFADRVNALTSVKDIHEQLVSRKNNEDSIAPMIPAVSSEDSNDPPDDTTKGDN